MSASELSAYILLIVFVFAAVHICRKWYELKSKLRIREEENKLRQEQFIEQQLDIIRQDELERKALAGDLHDQILNDLKQLKDSVGKISETEMTERIDLVSRNIREVMDSLSPVILENLGLLASIEDCLRSGAQEANYKLRVKFLVDKNVFDNYSLVEQTLVYRIVQEVKNNICKHSKASKVRVSAASVNSQIKIVIEDDGVGFENTSNDGSSTSRGLLYMKQRASLFGASVHWKPASENGDKKGCVVEIFLPEK